MKNTAIFKQQYALYQSYRVAGFDSVMNTGACLLGSVQGEHGALKAIVTESATDHDPWRVVNLKSQHHFDSIAVLGAIDEVEASSLALMHYGRLFDSANVHVDTMETSVHGLKRHLDCAYYHDKPRLIQPWQLNALQDVATVEKPMWDSLSLKSHGGQLSTLLFDMQCHDDHNGLLNAFDGLSSYLEQIGAIEQAFDSIIIDYQHLEYFMGLLHKAMNNASKGGVQVENIEISKPFKRKGVAQVAVSYLMKDGQSITILFHNPDSTPSKLTQSDTLISWKTLLNRRDVTGVVQPNQGEGLSMPVLAGRIMQLVNKNSARFVRTQAKKQQVQKDIDEAQARLQEKQAKLEQLNADIESVKKQLDEVQQSQLSQPLEQSDTDTKQSDVVIIQGDEFGEFPDTPEGKKALLKIAKQKLMDMRGHPIYCPALQSMVDISREGVSKITSFSGDTRKLKIIPVIPNLIATASNLVTKESYLESERLKGLIAYHYMQSKLELDNKFLHVKFVIKEKIGGHFQYDYTIEDEISNFDNILDKENASINEAFSATNYKSGDQLGSHLLASSQPSVPTHTDNIQINGKIVKKINGNGLGEIYESKKMSMQPIPDNNSGGSMDEKITSQCIEGVNKMLDSKKIPSFDGVLSATATCDRGAVNISPDLPVSCVANLSVSLENKQKDVNEFDSSIDSDESNDGKYVLNLFIEGEDYAVNADRSTSPTVTDTSNADVEYLQGILDGKIDFADHQQTDDMVENLEKIYERLTPESEPLFEKVADAFAAYAISLEVPGHD